MAVCSRCAVERRLAVAPRLAACICDPRDPSRVVHGLDEIIRTRLLMIAAGYEDGNDADTLRSDPMFKLAMGRLPDDGDLCPQPTLSRLENLPDTPALVRMGHAMVDHYGQSFRLVPRRIVLDIDDTFDAVRDGQRLPLFNPSASFPAATPPEPLPAPPVTMSTVFSRSWYSMATAA